MVELKKDKLDGVFNSLLRKKDKPEKADKVDIVSKPSKPEKTIKLNQVTYAFKLKTQENKEVTDKIKRYAYWKRMDISDVINSVLSAFIAAVEKEEGDLKPIPTKPVQPVKSIKVKKE